nr:ribonuclease H-like domain-containing protein [Tanacetum cinerariifolium]
MIKVLPLKTAEEVVARERERKARTTLLMTLPEDHLEKFHKMADAKEMWEAIKSRFGGNDESKKMQKYLLKQQFEGFYVSSSEGLHKGYDRFQTLLTLIMRTKPWLDTLSFDDLYNNLRVFERDVKDTTTSSSSKSQNVAFVSADNTSSTNDVSTDYSVSSPSISKSQKEGSLSYTDEFIHSFFFNQSRGHNFHKDQEVSQEDRQKLQFDTKDTVGFDKTKVECFNCHKICHFARDCRAKWNQDSKIRDGGYNGNKARENSRRPASQDDFKALVTIDGEAIDCSRHVEEDTQNFAMMAYSSSNSSSDNEVQSCSKTCAESYARLKKLYDEQRDKLECDLENTPVNDRYAKGMHAVPPPMTGNYMLSGPDVEIDYSQFTYGPKQISTDETDSKPVEFASSDSDSSVETTTSMPAPIDNAPKVISEPKVWTNAPIIEEYESDSDDDSINKRNTWDKVFKYNNGSQIRKSVNDPLGNQAHLADYQEFNGGSVAFGGSNGRIIRKGKIKADRLDFKDVYYVEELKHYNLFFVSQMCDQKNKVLFTDTDCLVLSPDFKLPDENQVLFKIPRQHNMYSFNLKNIDPSGDLSCLFAKALIDDLKNGVEG